MNKKALWIIGAQLVIIVGLIWAIVLLGQDEYESAQGDNDDEVEGPVRVIEQNGLQLVQLNLATQQNSGIHVQPLKAYDYQGNIKVLGTVISIQTLVDYNSQYQQLKAQLAVAESLLPNHQLQYQRYKQLNADDKNVSDKAVQEAQALVINDQTQIKSTEAQLKALTDTIVAQWGQPLATLVTQHPPSGPLHDLLMQKKVLVQASFPLNFKAPEANSSILVSPIQSEIKPIRAEYISQSIQTDISNIGKTYFYIAPADYLRVGMRVNVVPAQSSSSMVRGVFVPNQAIVWHGGMAWVYTKAKPDMFLRKPVASEIELDNGWFDNTLRPGTEVVTQGAQLLLSEEFKFQIKNENDD
ncbi:Multidrug efflux pump subunit AcrA (membrane-fusion protein) [Methylophilus rhizosphaerae]|uniref:Multidrug efflux pump subunit AcrA (Membrane-fusion protein) n=1 Tax=Methylophilus rhizosphaerae TaxID=492660 RepID=A0A1G9AV16_9PROT|nr:efflux RND transporter periplasmic adaptor subunit [Methylophilus rhizosphaerae]SDK31111.1 Multidrug efflux pump subunit AcrA (membrane-fusion protein) [Methylophilus rhizosphaerae]